MQPAVLPRAARGGPLPVTRSPLGLLGSLPAAARAGQPPGAPGRRGKDGCGRWQRPCAFPVPPRGSRGDAPPHAQGPAVGTIFVVSACPGQSMSKSRAAKEPPMKQPCTCSVTPTHASTPDAHSLPPPWTPMPTRRASRCVSFALGLALGTVRRSCDVVKALGGGLLGTLLQTLMVYGVVPVLAGQSIPVAVLREHACAPGMFAHLLSGGVLFPLEYLWIASHAFSGPPCCRACSGRGSSGPAPRSSWRRCWALRSSVRRSEACRPRCGRCQGTWSMAPLSAASPGHQRLRPGRPPAPGKAAQGR